MATYYISTTGTNSAGRNGGVGQEWATLSYACSRVTSAGNIIHVNAGTYTESSQCVLAVGVSIEGDGISSSIINSSVTSVPTIYAISAGTLGVNGNQHVSGITLHGTNPNTSYTGIHFQGRNLIKVYDCSISEFYYSGVKIYSNESRSTTGSPNYLNRRPDPALLSWTFDNEIYGCTITNCGAFTGGNEGCLSLIGQDGLLVHGNNFVADGFGGDHGDAIKGVSGFFRNCKFYGNTIRNVYDPVNTRWDFAIEFWNYYENNEFYNNNIEGGLDIVLSTRNGGLYSVWIHDNSIYQPVYYTGSRGVYIEFECDDIIIEKNRFNHMHMPIYSQQGQDIPHDVNNVRVNHNVMTDVGYGYFISEEIDYGAVDDTYTNIQFYNNVVIARSGADAGMWLGGAYRLINCEIKNNVIQAFNNGLKFKGTGGQGADYLYIQNNIFYNCGTQILWQSLTPTHYTNSGNLTSNPTFVSGTDFHLQAGSPAINAGLDVSPILQSSTTDIAGVTITSPPEIGAYQYGTDVPTSIPYVTTTSVTNIFTTSASTGGNVTHDGSLSVSVRGVVWKTSTSPTVLDSSTKDGGGEGVFSSALTGLNPSTHYYLRAYATNSLGTGYGNEVTFDTSAAIGGTSVPTVTTSAISNISYYTANGGGNVTHDGSISVTSKGIVWTTSLNPTTNNSSTNDGTGEGSFTSYMSSLNASTLYYVRAYATNSVGVGYGSNVSFYTSSIGAGSLLTGLMAYWNFNETSGNVIYDSFGTVHGSISGATLGAAGKLGTAYSFNAVANNYTTFGNVVKPTSGISFSAWLNPSTQLGGYAGFINNTYYISANEQYGYNVFIDSSKFLFELDNSTLQDKLYTNTLVTPSVWNHVVGTWDGSLIKLYVNGVLDASMVRTAQIAYDSRSLLRIGSHSSSFDYNGLIDEIGMWNRAITTAEVASLYNNGNGLAYPFNASTSTSIPTVTTAAVSNISTTSASCGGNVTSDGSLSVTAKGLCWNTSTDPTILNPSTNNGSGTGAYTGTLTGLSAATHYYVRAYASNDAGVAYGSNVQFDTSANVSGSSKKHVRTPGGKFMIYNGKRVSI